MTYIKQLDSLRALAVFIVIVSHWLKKDSFVIALQPGQLGVNIFFVLSGFLITGILLKSRAQAELTNSGKASIVKNFFIRRSLRIFPIYYLTIFLIFLFANPTETTIRHSLIYYLTYTTNFYFYHLHSWDGMTSHLWSLAVEEQFYLIWPWIILFSPKKVLLPCIGAFIGIGAASSYFINVENFGFILPFSCFDSFGLGALLSFILFYHSEYLIKFYRIGGLLAGICLVILIASLVLHTPTLIPSRTAQSIVTLWVITHVIYRRSIGQTRFFVLNNKALIFLGKISYGMYLYHLPLAWDYFFLSRHVNRYLPAGILQYEAYIVFIENFFILIGICWLSWILIERPILKFKKYFEYQEGKSFPLVAK
jgi:peptidoglycan/LPS O-acetylase OafA/YrhL